MGIEVIGPGTVKHTMILWRRWQESRRSERVFRRQFADATKALNDDQTAELCDMITAEMSITFKELDERGARSRRRDR